VSHRVPSSRQSYAERQRGASRAFAERRFSTPRSRAADELPAALSACARSHSTSSCASESLRPLMSRLNTLIVDPARLYPARHTAVDAAEDLLGGDGPAGFDPPGRPGGFYTHAKG
jgi:hypothetical protein